MIQQSHYWVYISERYQISILKRHLRPHALAMWETWVRSLGWEDPLGEDGNPLQCSCLENSMDRGA